MICLAIDTTGAHCTVALQAPDSGVQVLSERIGRGHAERLAPMVADLLAAHDVAPTDLARIGVTTGPGSFAGTRVGIAFARGLALATGAACVGLSNLAVIARQAGNPPTLAVLHDAKRGDVIVETWQEGASRGPERIRADVLGSWLRERIGAGGPVAGPGSTLAGDGFHDLKNVELAPSALLDLTASLTAADHPPAPFYARPPDAKLPGGVDPA